MDKIKDDMRAGRFVYPANRIAGVKDPKGTYYVTDGHHRMVAAQEIFRETGDAQPILHLLFWGLWTEVEKKPIDRRPMPGRTWWRSLRNWVGW